MFDSFGNHIDQNLIAFAARGDVAQVATFLCRGANSLLTSSNSSALSLAALNGHIECVKLLMPFSDPKRSDSQALRWAVENGHVECVKLLMPASIIKTPRVVSTVLLCGQHQILSLMLASEPLLLAGLDLSTCLADATSNGYAQLAGLLSSMIEKNAIAEHLPASTSRNHATARI